MTTHPEDAMTRERDVRAFAKGILHGDDEHKAWLLEAAENFIAGKPLPAPRGKGTALASAQQEPAPAAEAEEVARELAAVARRYRTHEVSLSSRKVADVLDDFAVALRRYAGDGGVTEQRSEEALEDAAIQLEARAYDLEHLYDKKARADEIFDIAQELRSRAAARAKSGEKGT